MDSALLCERLGPRQQETRCSPPPLILPQLFRLAAAASDAWPDEGRAGRRVEALPTWALQGGPQGLSGHSGTIGFPDYHAGHATLLLCYYVSCLIFKITICTGVCDEVVSLIPEVLCLLQVGGHSFWETLTCRPTAVASAVLTNEARN